MDRSLGVVIPAYKPDVERLVSYVHELHADLAPTTIRIELDAPTEPIPPGLESLPATLHTAATRRGKGAAITHGFEALTTDILAFVDADGSTPTDSFADVIAPVANGTADMSVGSRRHPNAVIRSHQTYARRWLGNIFAHVAQRVLNVVLHDYQCGAKALSQDTWRAVRTHIYEPGFAWDIELVAMADALGYRIEEVPIVWEDQPGSTVAPIGTSVALARALFIARHRAKLLQDNRLHSAIDEYREGRAPLVERAKWNDD